MRSIRVMAVLGILIFPMALFCVGIIHLAAIATDQKPAPEAVSAMAVVSYIGIFYALLFAIVVFAKIKKRTTYSIDTEPGLSAKLIELNDLKQRGILSDDEFQSMKIEVMKKG